MSQQMPRLNRFFIIFREVVHYGENVIMCRSLLIIILVKMSCGMARRAGSELQKGG